MADYQPFGAPETGLVPGSGPAARRRDVEPVPLVAGMLFILLAVLLMTGVDLSIDWFSHGVAWVVLIGAGIALLINEGVKARRRR